jgi:hypothetical protein
MNLHPQSVEEKHFICIKSLLTVFLSRKAVIIGLVYFKLCRGIWYRRCRNRKLPEPEQSLDINNHTGFPIWMLFFRADWQTRLELIIGDEMAGVIESLKPYDYIILDTPPVGLVSDVELSQYSDVTLYIGEDKKKKPST